MLNLNYKFIWLTILGLILPIQRTAAQSLEFDIPGLQTIGGGFNGLRGIGRGGFDGVSSLNFGGPFGQEIGNGLGTRFGNGLGTRFGGTRTFGADRLGLGSGVGGGSGLNLGTGLGSRFIDPDMRRLGLGGRTQFGPDSLFGQRGTLGGSRFGGTDGLRLAGTGLGGRGGTLGTTRLLGSTLGGGGTRLGGTGTTRLGTVNGLGTTGLNGLNGLGTSGLGVNDLGTRFAGTTGLQGGILDGGFGDTSLLARNRLRTNRLGANSGGGGARRTSLLGGLGQDDSNTFVDPITGQRVRVLNNRDASSVMASRTNSESAARRRVMNRFTRGRTAGRTATDASRVLRAGAPVRRIPATASNALRRRFTSATAPSPASRTRGRADDTEEANLTPVQRLARRRLEALNNIFQPVPPPLSTLFASAGNMSQINVAFGLPAYPTSSTTTTTTTTTAAPPTGNWRAFSNGQQPTGRNSGGNNLQRQIPRFGNRFLSSQRTVGGNNVVGQNVITNAAARNILQTVLGRRDTQPIFRGIRDDSLNGGGTVSNIVSDDARRFTQPVGNNIGNRQLDNSALNTLFSNQIPGQRPRQSLGFQTMNNVARNEMTNRFATPQNVATNIITQRNRPLIRRFIPENFNSLRGNEVTTQIANQLSPRPGMATFMQNFPNDIETSMSVLDVGQFPTLETPHAVNQQPTENFISMSSNVPGRSSIMQRQGDTTNIISVVSSVQQPLDNNGVSLAGLGTSTEISGMPFGEIITMQTVPETVWMPVNHFPRQTVPSRQLSQLTNNVDWALLDELMQQQAQQSSASTTDTRRQNMSPTQGTANDRLTLNQVDLSQFTTGVLDPVATTGLETQAAGRKPKPVKAFQPVSTLAVSQSAAATLAAQQASTAAAAQQRVAAAQAARAAEVARSTTAAEQAATEAARNTVVDQSAIAAAADRAAARIAAAEQAARAATVTATTATRPRRRGPIFAIVPLTSRASLADMRNFVRELSASISMGGSDPVVPVTVAETPTSTMEALPVVSPAVQVAPLNTLTEARELSQAQSVSSIATQRLPAINPATGIDSSRNIASEQSSTAIMNDSQFNVPVAAQNPSAENMALPVSTA